MREIKFRVWDKKYNRFVGETTRFNLDSSDSYPVTVLTVDQNRVIEQFTGETDKNGKEIYEGDILARKYGGKWVVEFDEGSFVYRCIESTMAIGWEEVIGNIHENGDLLK